MYVYCLGGDIVLTPMIQHQNVYLLKDWYSSYAYLLWSENCFMWVIISFNCLARFWARCMLLYWLSKGGRLKLHKPWISYALCVDSTIVISINYHYRKVEFRVGCGITVWVMVIDDVILERNGKQNFFFSGGWATLGGCWEFKLIQGFWGVPNESLWQINCGWLCVLDNTVFVKNVYKTFEFCVEKARFILKCFMSKKMFSYIDVIDLPCLSFYLKLWLLCSDLACVLVWCE